MDAILFVRALHILARFEAQGGYRSDALTQSYQWLKPNGKVCVVQHATNDIHADGRNGYLNQQTVINMYTAKGFGLIGWSDINKNTKDLADGPVWRLPPFLQGLEPGTQAYTDALNIGESNRMTLLFNKK